MGHHRATIIRNADKWGIQKRPYVGPYQRYSALAKKYGLTPSLVRRRLENNIPLGEPVEEAHWEGTDENIIKVKTDWTENSMPFRGQNDFKNKMYNARLRRSFEIKYGMTHAQLDRIIASIGWGSLIADEFLRIPLPEGLKQLQRRKRRAEMGKACG